MKPEFECHPLSWDAELQDDTAILDIVDLPKKASNLSVLEHDCYGCSPRLGCFFEDGLAGGARLLLNTSYGPNLLVVYDYEGKKLCESVLDPGNLGHYVYNTSYCGTTEQTPGESVIYPYIVAIVGLLLLCIAYDIVQIIKSWTHGTEREDPQNVAFDVDSARNGRRIPSISAFRGLAIVLMIFTNTGGGGLRFFNHTSWDGLTLGDIILPMFVFCVGLTMQVLMSHRYLKRSKSAWRCFRLKAIGVLIVNGGYYLDTLRTLGVLQRIALTQAAAAPLLNIWNVTQDDIRDADRPESVQSRIEDSERDQNDEITTEASETNDATVNLVASSDPVNPRIGFFRRTFGEWRYVGMPMLIVHFVLTPLIFLLYRFQVGNCPSGYLGPGGRDMGGAYKTCTGGVAGAFDRFALRTHIYTNPTSKALYDSIDFDPEGLFSTPFAVLNVVAGAHAGMILRFYPKRSSQAIRFGAYGSACILIASALHFTVMPINKNLWSLSYAYVTIGISYLIYLCIRFVVDRENSILPLKTLQIVGNNALVIYILQELFANRIPLQFYVGHEIIRRTFLSLWSTLLCVLIAHALESYGIHYSL